MADFTVEPLAEDALLLRFGDAVDAATNALVHEAALRLRAARIAGVTDIAPAYASLLLRFEFDACGGQRPVQWFHERLAPLLAATTDREPACADAIEIPVCYGGELGPDLAAVAAHAGLDATEVVARHAAGAYTVAMLGFAPGFPYLLGLDPALHMPRRAEPRIRVPRGSVAIGGAQTGIYPRELPGGWQLIGRTPVVLFDPQRENPCLLGPGQPVRFRAIGATEFAHLAAGPA